MKNGMSELELRLQAVASIRFCEARLDSAQENLCLSLSQFETSFLHMQNAYAAGVFDGELTTELHGHLSEIEQAVRIVRSCKRDIASLEKLLP